MFKTILFTHTDLDGAGCSIIFNLIMRSKNVKFDVLYCSNNEIDSKVQAAWDSGLLDKDTHICFGDICPSEELVKKLADAFPHPIRIWDHHISNININNIIYTAMVLPKDPQGMLNSGTSIMYDFFTNVPSWNQNLYHTNLLQKFVEAIREYDTYQWKETNNITSQKLNALFSILGMERFVDKYIKKLTKKEDIFSIGNINVAESVIDDNDIPYIDAKLEREQKYIDSITKDSVDIVTVKGLTAAVKFLSGDNISELSYQFLSKYPEIDVFIGISLGGGYYSFRSNKKDEINVASMLAKDIGGGGHPLAAGAPIRKDLRDQIMAMLLNNLNNK